MIEKVAPADVSVLILGESGTGKELIARAVHSQSGRKDARFVAINCAAIPETAARERAVRLREGRVHRRGQADARQDRSGRAAARCSSTRSATCRCALQAKLLRFLQDHVIERVGGRQEIPVDVRVVCATNKDLQQLIAEQRFRQDLYFRISEVTINVPPLRERRGGPTVLAHAMLRKFSGAHGRPKRGFTEEAIAALEAYSLARQRARAREQGEDAR